MDSINNILVAGYRGFCCFSSASYNLICKVWSKARIHLGTLKAKTVLSVRKIAYYIPKLGHYVQRLPGNGKELLPLTIRPSLLRAMKEFNNVNPLLVGRCECKEVVPVIEKTNDQPRDEWQQRISQIAMFKTVLAEHVDWQQEGCLRAWVSSTLLFLKEKTDTLRQDYHKLPKEFQHAIDFLTVLENELLSLKPLNSNASTIPKEGTFLQNYKEYTFSKGKMEDWMPQGNQGYNKKAPFFLSTFTDYHFLENKEGKAKLVLPRNQYKRPEGIKYYRHFELMKESTDNPAFVVLDIEKGQLPSSNNHQDLLYLSYVLFIQGNYGRALYYLNQSRQVATGDVQSTALREQLCEWFMQWTDQTPNAQAFKAKLLLVEHQQKESTLLSEIQLQMHDERTLPQLLDIAESYLKYKNKADPLLRLCPKDLNDLKRLVPRAPTWVTNRLESSVLSPLITEEVCHFYMEDNPAYQTALHWSLDKELAALEVTKPCETVAKTLPSHYFPSALFDVSPWLQTVKEPHSTRIKIERFYKEFKGLFLGDSLSARIGSMIAEDVLAHCNKTEEFNTVGPKASLIDLKAKLQRMEVDYLNREQQLRQEILQLFIPANISHSQTVERVILEQEAHFDDLFEKARQCFGLQDYSLLTEIGAIAKRQQKVLNEKMRNFQIARTERKLIQRKQEKVKELEGDRQNAILSVACAELLQEWPQYDRNHHPHAHLLLLLEDEHNVTISPNDVEDIQKLIFHNGTNAFLGDLFAAITNKHGYVAGIISMNNANHLPYETCDASVLKLLLIQHLRALNINITPQTVHGLNHALLAKISHLNKLDYDQIVQLTPVIHLLQKLLRFHADKLLVYSTEVDKVFDPRIDNMRPLEASKKTLESKYYLPVLELMKCLKTHSSLAIFAGFILNNRLDRQSDDLFEQHLHTLAEIAIAHFKIPFEKKLMVDYLTESHQNDAVTQESILAFYKDVVLEHQDADMVLKVQILHHFIGVFLRSMKTKKVGIDFARSKDGVSVKPLINRAPQEDIQNGSVLSTVLETCFEYFVNGFSHTSIQRYIEKIKEQAAQEQTPENTIDDTSLGQKFQASFGIPLSQVKEEDFKEIAKKCHSPELFKECLETILLKDLTYYEKGSHSTSHQLAYSLGGYSGIIRAPQYTQLLPHSIRTTNPPANPKNAFAQTFYGLLKGFDETKDCQTVSDARFGALQNEGNLDRDRRVQIKVDATSTLTSFYDSLKQKKGHKFNIIFEHTLLHQWNQEECLKGKSFLAKLLWTLVQNEASAIKKLNYQASYNQITAMRKRAVDLINRAITNIEALANIKEVASYKFSEKATIDPEKWGEPIILDPTTQTLTKMISAEKLLLEKLQTEIQELDIDPNVVNRCQDIIGICLNDLNPGLILDPEYLPDFVPNINHLAEAYTRIV